MTRNQNTPQKDTSTEIKLTEEFAKTIDLLENTSENYFITGNAGTGKTTLIKEFKERTEKSVALLAPTGIAALNLGGQTVHSFFKFPALIISKSLLDGRQNVSRIYKDIDCIIIDEVSMIRADVLDGIDQFLRMYGGDKNSAFGGTQVILVGDPFQLPPVVTETEKPTIDRLYKTPFFFSSHVYVTSQFKTVNLTQCHRQNDPVFIDILNKVRLGKADAKTLEPLNARLAKPLSKGQRRTNVCLVPTNKAANAVNFMELNKLGGAEFVYGANISGDFPDEKNSIIPRELHLRKGARVMYLRNTGNLVNGSTGTIAIVEKDEIEMKVDQTDEIVSVQKVLVDNVHYTFNKRTKRIEERVMGRMEQYPLRLAWAITVHKSQGMTFDEAEIDFSRNPFVEGQTYVALSRCRTLNGLTLTRPITPKDLLVDDRVVEFTKSLNLELSHK
ncbi:MAG TPA: AAA family ATPase [candidate division Zixibacteria bacterium]|nr:AAA family ATPase [candidate division Zixibacteria bacterium]